MKSISSTTRVIEWDELPARVREIPKNFNPLADGVFMKHQSEWTRIHTPIKVCKKGRRTGITFASALDKSITVASRKSAGGDNVFYIGDTKEKGLEFIGYMARFLSVIAKAQAEGISSIEEFLFEDQDEHGQTKYITAYRIRCASGFQAVALSSNPANIRGLQGIVIIDEAAFHRNVQAVLDAATALLIWGGRIEIISTHNGKSNPFNTLITDIEDGRYGDTAVVYTCTFDDAVTNGLYERRCVMTGEEATPESKKKWYEGIRNAYGPRKAQMREELDAIPRDGNGLSMPGVWIDDSMRAEHPVVRLALPEDFVLKPRSDRKIWVDDWIERNLDPVLALCVKEYRHVAGHDFARHRDFSVFTPMAITDNRRRVTPFVLEMHKVPTRQQQQIIWHILRNLPRFCGAAFDAGGNGETLAEDTADEFGHNRIAQIKLSRSWYGMWMPRMVQLFEDAMIDIPKDDNLGQDLRAIEEVDGVPMVAKARRKDLKDPDLYRHGDFSVSLGLAVFASIDLFQEPVAVASRGRRQSSVLFEGY